MPGAELSYWDRQFRFSALLPDFDAIIARMHKESTRFSDGRAFDRQFYGDDPRQWVEFCGQGNADAVMPVFIHGGYWRALDAVMHRHVLAGLGAISARVANVEYRLMPGVRLADLVQDVRAALDLIAHRSEARLLLIGHSAGAHLSLAANRDGALTDRLAGIVAISGIYDLQPIAWSFLQDEIDLSKEEIAEWSPYSFPNQGAERVLYVVGADETAEFQRQSEIMRARHGGALVRVEGANHMTVLDALKSADGSLIGGVNAWLHTGDCPALSLR